VQCVLLRARGDDRRRAPLSREPSRFRGVRRSWGVASRDRHAGRPSALPAACARHGWLVRRALHARGGGMTRRGRRKRREGADPVEATDAPGDPVLEAAPPQPSRRWLAGLKPLLTTALVAVAAFFTGLVLFNEVVMPRWVHRGTETRVPDLQN